ncbi:hypothetical protein ACFY4I_31030 [Streptomyces scabiei]|uniref:hypothetical protein n=1 Tax=Streptomyces scabiei TaxID=1930 RepID=UPI0036A629B3
MPTSSPDPPSCETLFSSSAARASPVLCAQVSLHTPLSPVPFTLQTLAVLLVGTALATVRGAVATAEEPTAASRLCCQITLTEDLDGLSLHVPETQR